MSQRVVALVAWLALCGPAWAQGPVNPIPAAQLTGPKGVEVGAAIVLNSTGSNAPGGVEFGLASGPEKTPVVTLKSDDGQMVIGFTTAPAPGTYQFYCIAWGAEVTKGRSPHAIAFWSVQVGALPPPVPPPGPPPGPPPVPPPGPPPSPTAGMRVLIVEETGDRTKMTRGQYQAIFNKQVRDYLHAKTPLGPDGKTTEWRQYDPNQDLAGEVQFWKDLMARPRASVPWLVIHGDGKVLHEGPVPEGADAMLALLKKYGG